MASSLSPKFAVFDIDGTVFRSGLYREVIFELLAQGNAPTAVRDAYELPEHEWKTRQSADAFYTFEQTLAVAFTQSLPHVRCDDFDAAAATVTERMSDHVYVYTRDLIAKLKSEGYTLIAISGSQEELVKPFADKYGFDIWVGQHYERGTDGYFTGNVVFTHDDKDVLLKQLVTEYGLSFDGSIGVGDTRSDISMLSTVETPIAFNPERQLFTHARVHGWRVVVERKNVTYELEPHGHTFILA